jgi:hypothetical protein
MVAASSSAGAQETRAVPRWVLIALFASAVGGLLFGYKYLDLVARGYPTRWAMPLVEEFTAAYGAAALLFGGVAPLLRHLRTRDASRLREATTVIVGVVLFSVGHTALNWLSRVSVFALLGVRYDYGRMPTRFAMEFPMDFIVYFVFVLVWTLLERQARARQREREAARLSGQVLEAELRTVRAQLEPHFLFNALNTISSVMYDDPAAADAMIGHLSDLLRGALGSGSAREVTVAAELENLGHYVALLRARFSDRLSIAIDAGPNVSHAAIPPLVLQPLVENAIRHGNASRGRPAAIEVRIAANSRTLDVVVHDDGPGVMARNDLFEKGVGLSATRDRLRLLYGDRQRFEVANDPAGGFTVLIAVPFRIADTAMSATQPVTSR